MKRMTLALRRRALAQIGLLVFDFDGVMTDNTVIVLEDGREAAVCNRSDGLGIGMLRDAGQAMMVLSKEQNPVVSARCRKLKLECRQGIDDKASVLTEILRERGIEPKNAAYVGNDLNDLGCMAIVGVPIAVADAYPPVLAAAKLVTKRDGGKGAVREVCDWFLEAKAGKKRG